MGRGGGLVLLGGIRKLAAQTVPDLMQKFLATSGNEHTRFELHTESSFTADLLQAVAEERLDMAFVSHPGDDTVFENVAFARLPFVVVAPPNHPLAQKSSVTLRETLPYPFVYFSKRGGLRRPIDALFQKIGATPKIAYETEEDTVVAGMAAAGFGIAIVPDHPVLRCMDLKIILLTDPDPGRTAYLCRKRGALQPTQRRSGSSPSARRSSARARRCNGQRRAETKNSAVAFSMRAAISASLAALPSAAW